MRRSDNFGKVRERDPNSPGMLFGRLVRQYMQIHGLQNQDVARLVYNNEERISSVADVLNGRNNPKPPTIARYRDALKIPQAAIDTIFLESAQAPTASLERIEREITSLAQSRHADQRTANALADVIETLKSQLAKQEITYESLARVLQDFLIDIDAGKTDPILWPATLRAVAGEVRRLRASLDRHTNESSAINASRVDAAKAMDLGDYETARAELEKVSVLTGQAYREHRNIFLNAAENHALSLASLGSLALSQSDYSRAKGYYQQVLQIDGPRMQKDTVERYTHLLRIAFTALIMRSNDYKSGRRLFDDMKQAGVKPDTVSYNGLMNLAHDYAIGVELLREMKLEGIRPDEFTFNIMINLAPEFHAGRTILQEMKQEGINPDKISYNTLMNLANDYDRARELLAEMKREGIKPSNVSYNTLIGLANDYATGRAVLREMKRKSIEPDDVSYNTLISLANDYATGRAVLREMKRKGIEPDHVSYNTLISLANDYATGRAVLREMKRKGIEPDDVSYNTLIRLANDYATARTALDEMKREGIKPSHFNYNKLISLANDYATARMVLDEMKREGVAPTEVNYAAAIGQARDYQEARAGLKEIADIRGGNIGDAQICAVLSWVKTFDEAMEIALECKALGYFVGRNVWESVFGKPIAKHTARELIAIYDSLPFKFESALQSPIRQYRKCGQLNQAFLMCLVSPHGEAAKSFYRDEYEGCKKMFESALGNGNIEDNLSYAYGIAATLNEDWPVARKHLKIALQRAYHEKRIAHINQLLGGAPPE